MFPIGQVRQQGEHTGLPYPDLATLKNRIASGQLEFTIVARDIGIYAFDHPDEVAFATVRTLAEATNSSPASVVRFVRSLGFDQFSQFRRLFQSDLARRHGKEPQAPGDLL